MRLAGLIVTFSLLATLDPAAQAPGGERTSVNGAHRSPCAKNGCDERSVINDERLLDRVAARGPAVPDPLVGPVQQAECRRHPVV